MAAAGRGQNLPAHTAAQLDFAAHIRNPEVNPRPRDVPAQRMQVYLDLFYNNIQNFLASAFPVSRDCLGDTAWHALVRSFVHQHASDSPYFLEISQEFLTFLGNRGLAGLPPFLLELAHYEWVELALDVAEAAGDDDSAPDTAPLDEAEHYRLSSVAMPLVYSFPVQQIGPEHQPDGPPAEATYLVVYRNASLQVRFLKANRVTHRLLTLLPDAPLGDCLDTIADELAAAGVTTPREAVRAQALKALEELQRAGIVRH